MQVKQTTYGTLRHNNGGLNNRQETKHKIQWNNKQTYPWGDDDDDDDVCKSEVLV